ncbi:hypothetical protein EDD86DRAFT_202826 [Gorgonomyces haynaldii]|nr:hypothetical protein EDD86DRAFT_202826 [Gorgonomyces haynaldii]
MILQTLAVLVLLNVCALGYLRLKRKTKSVIICVLGDIGRSPRMQNHGLSFSEAGYTVEFIGYRGTSPLPYVLERTRIHYLDKPASITRASQLSYLIQGIWRIVQQSITILRICISLDRPQAILVQNPPAIPTLFLFQLASLLTGSHLIIDWHNFGFSIMQLSRKGLIVTLAKKYEQFFGHTAFMHLTVTEAMKQELEQVWKVKGTVKVLYDQPPSHFKPLTPDEKAQFLSHIDWEGQELLMTDEKKDNVFVSNGKLDPNRPHLLISSTSWTEDEDFQILKNAMIKYDQLATSKVYMVITGKGPMKAGFMREISETRFTNVVFKTCFVPAEHYPRLVGCADLGVSLHTSSSGLDLPMKIVDLFGCGIPVCAIDFPCLKELVQHGSNGTVFKNADQLSTQLETLLSKEGKQQLSTYSKHILKEKKDWHSVWSKTFGN